MIYRVGSRAVLVELEDLSKVMDTHAALMAHPLDGQMDAVAAAKTVLLSFDSPRQARAAAERLADFDPPARDQAQAREITIDVVYDGEDLEEVAAHVGMTVEKLIDWHTSTAFTGAFGGFAPGFTYCVPADSEKALDIPRRSSPRTAVPAGAVALAGDFSAVYPRQSPGGWQIIGTTRTPMWDAGANPPAAIAPGDTVRYRAVQAHGDVDVAEAEAQVIDPVLSVVDAGVLTLIEDLGRAGNGNLGVTTTGAADRGAHHAVNQALGNDIAAATLENIGGLVLRAEKEIAVAVTGSATATVGTRRVELARPIALAPGQELVVEPGDGLRCYVGVRGGFDAELELGSRSTDILSGLGPKPVTAGQKLGVAGMEKETTRPGTNPVEPKEKITVVRCVPGPRDNWIAGGVTHLVDQTWTISEQSNRVGLRLKGQPLERANTSELPSEGIVAGSIQIPGNGEPVLFFRDHAVTGGYPVVATVIAEDLNLLAQLSPGDQLKFIVVDPDTLQPSE